jgi:L-serine deaminase
MSETALSKKRLLLTIEVETEEQVDELMRWMYATDKPMSANLVEIAWDKVCVSRKQADALEAMRQAFIDS